MYNASGPPGLPRLGKKPAEPQAITFSLMSYFDLDIKPPPAFEHPDPPQFFDYANSQHGDCVWAGAANETALWEHEGGKKAEFTTENVLSDYSACAGFDPAKPETDTGTEVAAACAYRRKTGIVDAQGQRHFIDAYAKLRLHDMRYLRAAIWTLGGVGLGFMFPRYAFEQSRNRTPWTVIKPSWWTRLKTKFGVSEISGGHYVPAIGIRPNGNIVCVTWGHLQEMTPDFYLKYADEVVGMLDLDRLSNRLSPEGFDERQLKLDLAKVSAGVVQA